MKILYLAFIDSEYPQLLRKFDQQIKAMQRINPDTMGVVMGPPGGRHDRFSFRYARIPRQTKIFYEACINVVESLKPDLVYFRYFLFDTHTVHFMEHCPAKVIFEHHTLECHELAEGPIRNADIECGPLILGKAAGCVGVTEEIAHYEGTRARPESIPYKAIPNGIDVRSLAPLHFQYAEDTLSMLCAAHFAFWHGIDRLLHGLATYQGAQRIHIHLAGEGQEMAHLQELVSTLQLEEKVSFHGMLERKKLDLLAQQCQLGIGVLGCHRKGMREHTSLKHREYCLQGLPFFYSGVDPDFQETSFTRIFPANDEPINMEELIAFAQAVEKNPRIHREMRAYAEKNLSWDTKSRQLYDFFGEVMRNEGAPVSVEVSERPYVSIVVLCANRRCLDSLPSVYAQTWLAHGVKGMEIVVVCPEEVLLDADIQAFAAAREDIPVTLVHDAMKSVAAARNAGIARARGVWISLLENGDTFRPDFLYLAFDMQQRCPELNIISCAVQMTGALDSAWNPPTYTVSALLQDNIFPYTALFRRHLWEELGGYDVSNPWETSDWHFWLRCMEHGIITRNLPHACLRHNLTEQQYLLANEFAHEARAMLYTQLPEIYGMDLVTQAHDVLRSMSTVSESRVQNVQQLYPDAALPYFWQGLAYEGRNEIPQALTCYMQAVTLAADDWQPALRLAILYTALGQHAKAQAMRAECIRINPVFEILLKAPS